MESKVIPPATEPPETKGVCGGSHKETYAISLIACLHRLLTLGRGLSQSEMDILAQHQNYQDPLRCHQTHRTTKWIHPWIIQSLLNARWRNHGSPHGRHDHICGELSEQCHAPLTSHIGPRFHIRNRSTHGPTWGLCAYPSHPRVLAPYLLNSGPLKGLHWGKVWGLAQDWWGFGN